MPPSSILLFAIAYTSSVIVLTVGEDSENHIDRPHIIFMLGDDVGWADLSFHGETQIPTPNMDALAADGIILNNYYVLPLCSPSRSALMTGVYPFRIGMQHAAVNTATPWGLPLNFKLLPQYFRELGYETHMIGKWHLGYFKTAYTPLQRGFDSFYGFYNGAMDYFNHTITDGPHTGLDFWENTTPLRSYTGNYSTNLFTERARHIITTRDKSKPLFLYISNQASHGALEAVPLQAPEENIQKFPYIGEENRTIFAGMIDALDQSVGHITEYLSDAGMLENSIIVFSSDNGGLPFGDYSNRGINWPLRGAKFTLWEGGNKAPAFIWSPLLKKSRIISDQMMHVVDWMPTLYAAAGGNTEELGSIDGVDLWEELSNDLPSERQEIVYNIDTAGNHSAIRHGNYKLFLGTSYYGYYEDRYDVPGGTRPQDDLDNLMEESRAAKVLKEFHGTQHFEYTPGWRKKAAVDCGNGTSNFVPRSPPYLFDLERDPCELNNLAETRPQLVQLLKKKLDAYAAHEVEPLDAPVDPRAYPECHDGLWMPWQD